MKTIVFCIPLFLFSWAFCQGQSSVSPVLALDQQVTLKRVTARTFLIPQAGVQSGRNMLLVGPVIRMGQVNQAYFGKPSLTGIQVTEAYFFSREGKKLQLYLAFKSKYQKTEEEWESNFWSVTSQAYRDYEMENEESIWENSMGPGLVWNFYRNFHLNGSLGLGYYLSFLKHEKPEELSAPVIIKDYRPYRNQGLVYSIQIGIVYKMDHVSRLTGKSNGR